MGNLASNVQNARNDKEGASEIDQLKPSSGKIKEIAAQGRELTGKLLDGASKVTTTVVITTASVYVGVIAISYMGLSTVMGLLALAAGALVMGYLSHGMLKKEWNPTKFINFSPQAA